MANTYLSTSGETVARELLVACLNTGTSSTPVWSPLGKRVEDSSASYDWSQETIKDIRGATYGTLKKPTVSQNFEPYPLDSGDSALAKLHEMAVINNDYTGLCNLDMIMVHQYYGEVQTQVNHYFFERYDSCMAVISSVGGEGGGNIEDAIEITYGGNRTTGTCTITNGVITIDT